MATGPTEVIIFSYQVGFGDCFLIRFAYPDSARHVLIDFGTTGLPPEAAKNQMQTIARDIEDKSGGKLDIVVATHRHADHISGFATGADDASGNIIRRIATDALVLQPWTEQGDLAIDATGPAATPRQAAAHRRTTLAAMQAVSAQLVAMLDTKRLNHVRPAIRDQLRFIGEDNIANESAVKNLMGMGSKRLYVHHGFAVDLATVLPGVTMHVLGPPTVDQSSAVAKQRSRDANEYWQLASKTFAAAAGTSGPAASNDTPALFPGHPVMPHYQLPMAARWFADRVNRADADEMMALVRSLDRAMNNTSLILLFEAGGKKLLFPGDAQIENWSFALQDPASLALLADVDLYKVGHHGSLNATPKSLWRQFAKKGAKTKPGRLKSVLSTMPGKHGSATKHTEVPRATLLAELTGQSDLHATHLLEPGVLHLPPIVFKLA